MAGKIFQHVAANLQLQHDFLSEKYPCLDSSNSILFSKIFQLITEYKVCSIIIPTATCTMSLVFHMAYVHVMYIRT